MSNERKHRIGVIGCGKICAIYFENLPRFQNLEVVACADLDPERARLAGETYRIPQVLTPDDLIASPDVDIVVNLTIPSAHFEVSRAALRAGKHVYNEKPLTVRRRDARELMGYAAQKGLRIGCAPDTILGAGVQTCRRLIDEGAIGEPVAANAFFMSRGVEGWHPNPEFFYKKGAGPLFDMGPYYLSALVTLLGPARSVAASARVSFPKREITSEPLRGGKIKVETPTHIVSSIGFESGPIGNLVTSFDVSGSRFGSTIEIYGSEGTLVVPDPNRYTGPALLQVGGGEWHEVQDESCYFENWRGLGVAEMAAAMAADRPHRASDRLAYHVLDIMHSSLDSAEAGRRAELASTVARPEPMPAGLTEGQVEPAKKSG